MKITKTYCDCCGEELMSGHSVRAFELQSITFRKTNPLGKLHHIEGCGSDANINWQDVCYSCQEALADSLYKTIRNLRDLPMEAKHEN